MKRKFTNKFKEKINEIEYQPTQADWKSFSSALDKSVPFDVGMTSGVEVASGGATATAAATWTSMFTKFFFVSVIGIGVFAGVALNSASNENKQTSEYSNMLTIEQSNIQKEDLQERNESKQKNKRTEELKNKRANELKNKRAIDQTSNRSNELKNKRSTDLNQKFKFGAPFNSNQIQKAKVPEKKIVINTQKQNASESTIIQKGNSNNTNNNFIEKNNTDLKKQTKTSQAASSLEEQNKNMLHKEIETKTANSNIGLNFLPALPIGRKDEGIENLLNEYSSSLLLSEEATMDLVFSFENIRIQALYLGSADYNGLSLTVMEPLKGNDLCDFIVGIGLTAIDYTHNYPWLRHVKYGDFNQTSEPDLFVDSEFSVSIIAEAKKNIWKEKFSAYVNLKPELVVERIGTYFQHDEATLTTHYLPYEMADQGRTKEILLSAGLGIDYSINNKMEVRVGYEHGFITEVAAAKTYNNKAIKRGHFNIGLNYSFIQKIK